MSKPLAYLDQSVLGLLPQRQTGLVNSSNVQWVYSKEHFAEIRRSSNPDQYLLALDRLNAKLIELELINWKISGSAKLIDGPTASQHYSNYCQALSDVDFNENLFDPFQAWVNGGGDENLLREFPRHIAEQILALVECLPLDQRLAMSAVDLEGDLGTMEGLLELISSYRFGILLDLPAVELQATNFLGSIRPTSKGTNHGRLILE